MPPLPAPLPAPAIVLSVDAKDDASLVARLKAMVAAPAGSELAAVAPAAHNTDGVCVCVCVRIRASV